MDFTTSIFGQSVKLKPLQNPEYVRDISQDSIFYYPYNLFLSFVLFVEQSTSDPMIPYYLLTSLMKAMLYCLVLHVADDDDDLSEHCIFFVQKKTFYIGACCQLISSHKKTFRLYNITL